MGKRVDPLVKEDAAFLRRSLTPTQLSESAVSLMREGDKRREENAALRELVRELAEELQMMCGQELRPYAVKLLARAKAVTG